MTTTTPASPFSPDLQRRATELVAQMTLEEKAGLTSGSDFWHTKGVERLGLEPVMVTDGPHGLRKQAGDTDHLGLNASVPATCFPTAAALGSTWDPELVERVGRALGEETAANDVAVILGPGVNMKRSPLCGRNFEYVSEDPLLAGRIAAALVAGIQSQGVGTSLKHFAANNQETDRLRVDAQVDERTLREVYLPAFEQVVRRCQPWTVMCSYNRINGTYASEDPWLLTEVLREQWGYEGLVVSDWGAVNERVPGLAAGLDLEMPASGGRTDAQVVAAVRSGELDESVLDAAATRVTAMILAGHATLGARTGVGPDGATAFDADAHHAIARQAAAAGTVLLRNDKVPGPDGAAPVLPLSAAGLTAEAPLALIGEFARTPRYQGAGSSQINPTRLDTALEAFEAALGARAVRFAPGYRLAEAAGKPGQELGAAELRQQAVEAARGATAVIVAGLPQASESEGYDRTHMDIPTDQVDLIRAVGEAAARTVVVLVGGSAMEVASWQEAADALLVAWLGGQAGGSAIADVVLGAVAPTGHLAETLPVALSDVPAQLNFPGADSQVRYGEGVFIGYRAFDAMSREVAYPFGHGLTYTSFALSDLVVAPAAGSGAVVAGGAMSPADTAAQDTVLATVRATVTNTGAREGAQVVQLYVGREGTGHVQRAARELAGFAKVSLAPGESREVELPVTQRDLAFWDAPTGAWVVEAGRYTVNVGFSSRDLPLAESIEVQAPPLVRPLKMDSSVKEWLDHPVGGPLMRAELPEFVAGLEADPSTYELMTPMPANRLAVFPGGFGWERYLALLARAQRAEPPA